MAPQPTAREAPHITLLPDQAGLVPPSIEALRSCLDLGPRPWSERPPEFGVVVAVPACNEEGRIADCLAALAVQRTPTGAPLRRGSFDVLVLANNCTDGTAEVARRMASRVPYRLLVEDCRLERPIAHAGGARKAAMDRAAERLAPYGAELGLIFTTDADSRVAPTWIAAKLAAFRRGADAVAGYVDPDPGEYVALGAAFLQRGRSEDTYLTALAEIDAICDPRPHDPWPNHRVASGASLAVSLGAYRAIGGLPLLPLGEDAALVRALERGGFRVRHALDAIVNTSCRFDGRAKGGAADTMRLRHAEPDAFCSDDLEPALRALRRSVWKGRLRRLHATAQLASVAPWAASLGIERSAAATLARVGADRSFVDVWDAVEVASSILGPKRPLRPSDLPREINRAMRIIALLRAAPVFRPPSGGRADKRLAEPNDEPAIAAAWPR